MTARDIVMGAAGAASIDKTYIEDVFSTYLYTGNGTSQTITNGIDLAGKGGLVWTYPRSKTTGGQHCLVDTARGRAYVLASNLTNGNSAASGSTQDLTSFNSDGFSIGTSYNSFINDSGIEEVAWTFRKAPKFFDVQTKSHTNGTASTVDLSPLGTVGMVVVKRTDSTGNWYVWHNELTSGYNAYLNTTDAQFNTNSYLSVSGTTLTIDSGMPTGSYVVYAYAHDTTTDGLIRCGSYTGNGSTTGPEINLGWEPQLVIIKRATGGTSNWRFWDNMRGVYTGYNDASLSANLTSVETLYNYLSFTSTGFSIVDSGSEVNTLGSTYIYMAIRRGPMRTPTDGTKVFQPVVRTGSGGAAVVNTTITPDLVIHKVRNNATGAPYWLDRLRRNYYVLSNGGQSEAQLATAFPPQMWDNQTGYDIAGAAIGVNNASYSYIDWVFKRAPGFFDIVNMASSSDTPHNLGVQPELVINKSRSVTGAWYVSIKEIGSGGILEGQLNTTNSFVTRYTPTYDSVVTSSNLSGSYFGGSAPVIFYLFASCPGVSKVGTYTGTGTTNSINCGFTAGARFVLIKRTDSTGDWYVWDTARGLVAGNDSYLLLNSAAAEVTNTDYIDPYSAGFELSSTAPAALNANGGTYLYLAIA